MSDENEQYLGVDATTELIKNIKAVLKSKQDTLTVGDNITISSDNTISAVDTKYSDATSEISGLMSSTDKTNLDAFIQSSNNLVIPVAVCTVLGVNPIKKVELENYKLIAGTVIAVKFTDITSWETDPITVSLNINETGEIPVVAQGISSNLDILAISKFNANLFCQDLVHLFLYDGTNYEMLDYGAYTDTRTTTGSGKRNSQMLYLVGASSQNSSGAVTYTNSNCYISDSNLYSNGNKVLTGITSSDVTDALGYTPYDSTNPDGYTSNEGTVTSVSIKMNGVEKGTITDSGTIDLGTVITDVSDKQDSSTAVTHTDSTAVGSDTQPVYIASDGTATAIGYTIEKSVPSDAIFTDTTYESKEAVESGTDLSLVTTGEKYKWDNNGGGTVTSVSVKMNDSVKGTVTDSGTIDLGTVITDISGKENVKEITLTADGWNAPKIYFTSLPSSVVTTYSLSLTTYASKIVPICWIKDSEWSASSAMVVCNGVSKSGTFYRYNYRTINNIKYNMGVLRDADFTGCDITGIDYYTTDQFYHVAPVADEVTDTVLNVLRYQSDYNSESDYPSNSLLMFSSGKIYSTDKKSVAYPLSGPTYESKEAAEGGTDLSLVTTGEKYAWNNAAGGGTVTSVSVEMNGEVKGTVTDSGTIDLGTVITEHQDISGKQDKLTVTGTATKPIYVSADGTISECAYELNKTVPSDAVFTDTTYSSKSAASGGTDVSLVTTGEKYAWNNKATSSDIASAIAGLDVSSVGGTGKYISAISETDGKISATTATFPTIPTVNNATLTIQKNGTNISTFTANSATDVTANIVVPTKVSELTNDSGYTSNVGTITEIKMNGASKGTSGVVDLGTIMTATTVTGTLEAGETSIVLSSDAITTDSTIEPFFWADGETEPICYNTITVTSGSVTMTFDARDEDSQIKLRIS